MIAAPIAAWLVKHLAARVLGVAAGGLIILTNSKTLLEAVGVPGVGVAVAAALVFVLWVSGIVWAVKQERLSRPRPGRRGGARPPPPDPHVVDVRRLPHPRGAAYARACGSVSTKSTVSADISDKLAICASPPKPTMPSGP